jgi:hypothetical protein
MNGGRLDFLKNNVEQASLIVVALQFNTPASFVPRGSGRASRMIHFYLIQYAYRGQSMVSTN